MAKNDLLMAVMAEAGFSRKGLAAHVRDLAAKDGKGIKPDHVSVGRWLDGSVPRSDTPQFICLALSLKLGRPVSFSDIGMPLAPTPDNTFGLAERGVKYPTDYAESIDLLSGLISSDSDDGQGVRDLRWDRSASAQTIARFVFGLSLDSADHGSGGGSSALASRIRDTAAHLMELDFKVGGGSTRKLLLFYFQSDVVPALRRNYAESEKRAVFGAAAEVAQLLGWTAYDAGRHGAAQRYFTQALRLADEAGDRLLGGRLLANMSHQANYLGNYEDATHLARAAQAVTLRTPVATVSSMFLAMEARALAGSGRSRESVHALHRAEAAFERKDADRDPAWISYFDREELAGEAAHCFRDLGQSAEARTFGAEASAGHSPVRTRAFIGMVNAAAALKARDLEEAVALAAEAMDQAGELQSMRYARYLTDFSRSLAEQYANDPKATALVARTRKNVASLADDSSAPLR